MPDPESPPAPPTPHRRLDGWKEIAQYLNRSVRTAYRWERDLGLPVRRLGTGKGEVVFALPEELDAWRERLEVTHNGEAALRAEPDGPERRPGAPPPSAPPGRTAGAGGAASIRRWRALRWPLVAMAALVVGVLGYGVYRVLASPPKAVTWRVLGGELEVFDAQHRLLWRRAFQPSLEDALYAHRFAAHDSGRHLRRAARRWPSGTPLSRESRYSRGAGGCTASTSADGSSSTISPPVRCDTASRRMRGPGGPNTCSSPMSRRGRRPSGW